MSEAEVIAIFTRRIRLYWRVQAVLVALMLLGMGGLAWAFFNDFFEGRGTLAVASVVAVFVVGNLPWIPIFVIPICPACGKRAIKLTYNGAFHPKTCFQCGARLK